MRVRRSDRPRGWPFALGMFAFGLVLAPPRLVAQAPGKPPRAQVPAPPAAGPPARPLPSSPLNGELSAGQLLAMPLPDDARLGAALQLASRGEFEEAESAATALATAKSPTLPRDRLERERARLAALAKLRQDLLARCVADKLKLRVDCEGKPLSGTVVEQTTGQFTLADARGKRQSFALSSMRPEELLRRLSELKLELGTPATRAYAALLAGRKAWSKGIEKAADDESVALRGDAAELASLLEKGDAAQSIQELATRALPADGPAADVMVAAIRQLMSTHGKQPFVADRKPTLRDLASFALTKSSEAKGLRGAGLKGVVTELADGRVQISYDFTSPDELDDFQSSDRTHFSWSKLPPISMPQEDWGHAVKDGQLEVKGRGCLRHRLLLDTPVKLEIDCTYGRMQSGLTTLSTLRPAICDDGKGSLVTNLDLLWIEVIDFATSTRQRSQQSGDAKVSTDRPLHIVLSHDGKRAQLQCEGRPDQYVPAAMRTRGNVALYWMADTTNKIDKLSIEGRLAPGSLADLCKEANQLELFKIFGE